MSVHRIAFSGYYLCKKGYLLQCFAHLTDWENLNKQVRYQVEDNLEQLWADDW
jgi:hypothetical protein